jgi:hypothetical protein
MSSIYALRLAQDLQAKRFDLRSHAPARQFDPPELRLTAFIRQDFAYRALKLMQELRQQVPVHPQPLQAKKRCSVHA